MTKKNNKAGTFGSPFGASGGIAPIVPIPTSRSIYVSAAGTVSGTGTIEDPYDDLATAISAAEALASQSVSVICIDSSKFILPSTITITAPGLVINLGAASVISPGTSEAFIHNVPVAAFSIPTSISVGLLCNFDIIDGVPVGNEAGPLVTGMSGNLFIRNGRFLCANTDPDDVGILNGSDDSTINVDLAFVILDDGFLFGTTATDSLQISGFVEGEDLPIADESVTPDNAVMLQAGSKRWSSFNLSREILDNDVLTPTLGGINIYQSSNASLPSYKDSAGVVHRFESSSPGGGPLVQRVRTQINANNSTVSTGMAETSIFELIAPTSATNRIEVKCEFQTVSFAAGPNAISRFGDFELRRTTGTPATLGFSAAGRVLTAASTAVAQSLDSVTLSCQELAGDTASHRYAIWFAAGEAAVTTSINSASNMSTFITIEEYFVPAFILKLSGDFVVGNTIDLTVNGNSINQVSFVGDSDTTLSEVRDELLLLDILGAVVKEGSILKLYSAKTTNLSVSNAIVVGGASQPTIEIIGV